MTAFKIIAIAIFTSSMALAQEPAPTLSPHSIGAEVSPAKNLTKPIVSASLLAVGIGSVIYGIAQDREVASSVKKGDCGCAENAQTKRNIGYAVGTALLAGGVTFYILF